MTVHVQTGNMLDVVVEGKSIGLKQRDSDHRKYEVIWLPDPEAVATTLLAEVRRLEPATTTPPAEGVDTMAETCYMAVAAEAHYYYQATNFEAAELQIKNAVDAAQSTLATELLRVVEAVEPIAGRFAASDHKKRTVAAIRAECVRLKVEVEVKDVR